MEDNAILYSIVKKCTFLYGDAIVSKERIIEQYLYFFAKQFNPSDRSLNFAFHTGSVCFDIVSVAALMIGCLAYEFSTNDEILSELEMDDMVLYKGERYRWGGIEKYSLPGEPVEDFAVLFQDARGKNGSSTSYIRYEQNKHLIKPYYGTSSVTDGRGIRKENTCRNEFISNVLGVPIAEVPNTIDISVVVVADKNEFIDICRHLRILFNGDKIIELTDIVPVSYYTGNGEQIQIGKNATKAEAVIKVTSKISMARDLVLSRNGNRTVGIVIMGSDSLNTLSGDMNDLLRRKSLKFACVITPYNSELCDTIVKQHETARIFACTRELLSGSRHLVKSANKLTKELNSHISNILTRTIETQRVEGCWNWEQYKKLKEKLYAVKQSNWSGEDRDDFVLSAYALLNLFSTSFFSMEIFENTVSSGAINLTVASPEKRISELMLIADKTVFMKEQCYDISTSLLDMYSAIYKSSPKGVALHNFLRLHRSENIVLVVPKAYYVDIFSNLFHPEFENVRCITANRFCVNDEYDRVIVTGDYVGKRFDALQCFAAPNITLFLYDYEEKIFSFRKRKSAKSERILNARIKNLEGDDYVKAVEVQESDNLEVTDHTMKEFSDLDAFVESMGVFDIRKFSAGSGSESANTTEVKYVGTFTTGEHILFSKYYSAVVYDQNTDEVTEKSPEKLSAGDILVFTKRNDYTSNIVDQIFDQLMHTDKLTAEVMDAAEKAYYWKEALREFKTSHDLTYRAIAKEMKKFGSSLQEVAIRQWLIEESHIIGPRDARTMECIAKVTQDPYLLSDPNAYFEACRVVRHYRKKILDLIAQAIHDKLSNKVPEQGSAFEVVFTNIENLSETMELENVSELDDVAIVSNGMVNRPISESEVLL